ncbi:cytochrome c biogenesis protein CcdA [Chitinophagaceae bacterium 26-R-25]|nr:cytochrome c biogenesis protein CcdA [Chitinophagaceae bacterium 26-R-25]
MFSKFTHTILTACLLLVGCNLFAQKDSVIKVTATQERLNDKESVIRLKVTTAPGNKIYSIDKKTEESVSSSVTFDSSVQKELKGPIQESGKAITEKDSILLADVKYYKDSVIWSQTVQTPTDKKEFEGKISYMVKVGDDYKNGDESFDVTVKQTDAASGKAGATSADPTETKRSLPRTFWICLLAGLVAVITPCVFPLMPVTVSFFLKRSKTRSEGVRNALWYSLSIILIYTIPTLLLTIIFGNKVLYTISTSAISNLVFFAIFMVFAISFLGAFELTLPSSWATKADEKAGKGGAFGIFFMALTLVIVSFSCTGPIVGSLLGQTSSQGISAAPIIGMLGFSIGLALPFSIFALFPSMLKSLPKSGGWLNSVKVVFGFVELALGMKFLSNVDLIYGWHLLDREIFLVIWIVIAIMLGLYLLGKLKFSHDSDMPYISIPRLFLAIASFCFALYLTPGLWGAPLKALGGLLPPTTTQDFNLDELQYKIGSAPATSTSANASAVKPPVKYIDKLHVPFGLTAYYDLEEGIAAAKASNKPIMLDFTGHSCANCRKMENAVWKDPDVLKRMKEDFVLVSLYVDENSKLPEEERYTNANGEKIVTVGEKNLDYEIKLTNNPSQPQYVFIDHEGKIIKNAGGYDPDIPRFIKILDEVKEGFKKK